MTPIFDATVSHFMLWLTVHEGVSYYVLFLGTFFETLIGTCFFIPGELFLLSGSILAGAHKLSLPLVLLALYGGAILGDSSSYGIGRLSGASIFRADRRFFSLENYAKGEALFAKYGSMGIFFARLLGPLSWITPFLAGIYKVPYRTFLPYNLAGIFVGVGEFIVAGYFLGRHSASLLPFFHRYLFLLLIIGVLTYAVVHTGKRVIRTKRAGESTETPLQ